VTDALIVFCTCGTAEDARRLARALVEEGLAACVTTLPGVESIYRWQGAVETATEFLLLIKSTQERLPNLERRIVELHSYDTPEILAVPVSAGLDRYLEWLRS
jgi:periplasmic divalent cation tolerance protein